MLLALPHPPYVLTHSLPTLFISSFDFLLLGVSGIEGGGWGSQCIEHEHAEMEGCELNMYVLSALLYHCSGMLPFCGVSVFACVHMCMSVSQPWMSHISRGHLPRFLC